MAIGPNTSRFGMLMASIAALSLAAPITFDPAQTQPSRWVDPYGRQPQSHAQWAAGVGRDALAYLVIGEAVGTGKGANQNVVDIVVNSQVYPDVVSELAQFRTDLVAAGYEVRIDTIRGMSAPALRTHLAGLAGLVGALFVGECPVEWYEINGWGAWEEFPIDLYFTDLNGTWADTDLDGILDSHTGNVAPEIWLGRLYARTLTWDSETRLYKRYFQKNHLYRTHQLTLPQRALSYVDDDWYGWGSCSVNLVYPITTTIEDMALTTAQGYRQQLQQGYEWIHLCSHSSPWGHTFKYPDVTIQYKGTVFNYELFVLEPKAHFYNLFACSGTRFVEENYSAGWYVFHDSCGLLALGSAKTGGMLTFQDFYTPLSQGLSIGNAFKAWFVRNGESSRAWFYGLNLLGDPTLKPKEQGGDYVAPPPQQFHGAFAEVVAPDSESDGMPAIASEPSGRIWAVWETGRSITNGRCDIFSAYRTTAWSSGMPVGSFIYWDYNPTVGLDSLDRPLAVWAGWENIGGNYQYDLFWSYYTGSAWSNRALVHPLDPTSDMKPSLARDRNKRPWIAWQTKRDVNSNIYVTYYSGSGWSTPRAVSNNPAEEVGPKIICDNTGRLWVSYSRRSADRSQIWGSYYDGVNWIETGPVSQNQERAYNPSAAVTGTGKVWVTWQSYDGGNGEIFGSYYTGTGWSAPINISNHVLNDMSPSMAADGNGHAWVVWHTNRDGNWNIYYATCQDQSWTAPQVLDANPGVDMNPAIASAPSNKMWVIWQNYSANNWEIYALQKDAVEIEEKEARDKMLEARFTIWPNPARSDVRCQISGVSMKNTKIKVYNIAGKMVKEMPLSVGGGSAGAHSYQFVLNLSDLAAGTYFIGLESGAGNEVQKLSIVK